MKRLFPIVVALVAVSGVSLTAQSADVVFADDVKQYLLTGENTHEIKAIVTISTDKMLVQRGVINITEIPYAGITGITYDRRSRVRRMAPSFGKRLQHFLTIQFKVNGVGDYVELEMAKSVAPQLIAMLEARSGVKIDKTGM